MSDWATGAFALGGVAIGSGLTYFGDRAKWKRERRARARERARAAKCEALDELQAFVEDVYNRALTLGMYSSPGDDAPVQTQIAYNERKIAWNVVIMEGHSRIARLCSRVGREEVPLRQEVMKFFDDLSVGFEPAPMPPSERPKFAETVENYAVLQHILGAYREQILASED